MKVIFSSVSLIRITYYLAMSLVIFSCGKSDKTTETQLDNGKPLFVPTKLVQQIDKVLQLDNETAYNRVFPHFFNDGKTPYYHFYNSLNRQLYFYDFQTGEIAQKVTLFKDGPNEIKGRIQSYFVHAKDSIFVTTIYSNNYLLNSKGEILDQVNIAIETGEFYYSEGRWEFSDPSGYKDGIVYTGRRVFAPLIGAENTLRSELDFKKGTFEQTFLEEKRIVPYYDTYAPKALEMAKKGVIQPITKIVVGEPMHLYASSQMNDSIYEYQDEKFIGAYYVGNPSEKTATLQEFMDITSVNNEGKFNSVTYNSERPTNYSDMFMDTNKKWIYRILIHGTYGEEIANQTKKIIHTDAASLIVFDMVNKRSYVIDIPMDKVYVSPYRNGIFAIDKQVYFPIKEQEVESEKRYKVFKIE